MNELSWEEQALKSDINEGQWPIIFYMFIGHRQK